jgi:hypothetical protein
VLIAVLPCNALVERRGPTLAVLVSCRALSPGPHLSSVVPQTTLCTSLRLSHPTLGCTVHPHYIRTCRRQGAGLRLKFTRTADWRAGRFGSVLTSVARCRVQVQAVVVAAHRSSLDPHW